MPEKRNPDLDVLARLTGVRSSKLSFYRQYRRTVTSLDRSIRALASASTALTAISAGPVRLVEEFLPAVVETMRADWAAVLAEHPAFPQGLYVRAATPSGLLAEPDLPEGLPAEIVSLLQTEQTEAGGRRSEPGMPARRRVPLRWAQDGWGWLIIAAPPERTADDTEEAILATLANQLVTAVQVTYLLAEGERLRAAATAAYDEVSAHARELVGTNRQLRLARSALARAREKEVVEAERERLARELHDSVAQRVLAIGLALEWCRGVADDPALQTRLGETQELARGTVETIRNAIFELSAVEDRQLGGLLPSMRAIVTQLPPDGPEVTVHRVGTPVELALATERTLLIVLREALFNVVLHSGATRARVRVTYALDAVALSVTDNGHGTPDQLYQHLHEALRSRSGYHRGLSFVYGRIRELGGSLEVSAATGGGVRLTVRIPLEERPEP